MAGRSEIPPPPRAGESPENCRRCELWKHATRAVAGEGATNASIKRRLHKRPELRHIKACNNWLVAEILAGPGE